MWFSKYYGNEAEKFNDLLETYIKTSEEVVFEECIAILGSGGEIDDYSVSRLFMHKAFLQYEVSIDSVKYFLENVDLQSEPDGKYDLKLEYNRAFGLAYAYSGEYELSIEYLSKNVTLANEGKTDLQDALNAYSDLAVPHYFSGNTKMALEMWKKSISIAYSKQEYESVYTNALNVAFIHGENAELDSAYKYKDLCIEMNETYGLDEDMANFNLSMGVIEYYAENFKKAIEYFDLARENYGNGDLNIYTKAVANVASCYMQLGESEKALTYIEKALSESSNTTEKSYRVNLLSLMGEIQFDLGQFKTAYLYLDSSKVLKEEFINETRTKQIAEFQEKFKSAEKDKIIAEQELAFQHEKSAKEQEELKNDIHEKEKWYLYIGIGLVALFGVFMYRRFQISQKQRRTIEKQKVEVESQKAKIEIQHHELEEVHHEISDSINYAEKLQLAILPDREDLIRNLGQGFVLFKPKDVVSGDFYWTVKKNEKVFFAAADCTGHGVPGAMVSVVCSNALNRAVNEMKLYEPAAILNKTRELVVETFARSGQDVKDGMDVAVCSISKDKLEYSGANNPLWLVRKTDQVSDEMREQNHTFELNGYSLIEIKSDRQPVGLYSIMEPFTEHSFDVISGDTIYVFTDGYADQFGGDKGKKMKYKVFKQHLLEIQELSMDEQKVELEKIFETWKGDFDQIDDVCVIGVRV